ncbi:MAG: hypothetical protein ACKOTH_00310, partial [Solirubrobacterales bacterium]
GQERSEAPAPQGARQVFTAMPVGPSSDPAGRDIVAAQKMALSEPPVGGDAPEGDVEGARLVALELVMRGESDDEARRHLESAFPGVDAAAVLEKTRATIAS